MAYTKQLELSFRAYNQTKKPTVAKAQFHIQ